MAEVKSRKQLNFPTFKVTNGVPFVVRLDGPIFLGEQVDKAKVDSSGKKMDPPHLVLVTPLNDESQYHLIAGAVLKSELDKLFPKNSYVGKWFELTKLDKKEGKGYNPYLVVEVKVG